MKQRFTSKQTSINSTKAPAVYSMKRAVDVMTGKTVVDLGGGRFDTAVEAARGDVVRLAATKAAALPGWNVARFGRLIQATQKR